MENAYINNIYLVTNNLEDIIQSVEQNAVDFKYYSGSFENFQKDSRNHEIREQDKFVFINDLIIIEKEFYTDSVTKTKKKEFLTRMDIDYPHFLFLVRNHNKKDNISLDYYDDDFYYFLSNEEKESKTLKINSYFFELLFKCIVNRKSVHYYIVNSFENIVESVIISRQKKKIESLYKNLEALSKIDVLTKVLNRRAFFEAMELEKKRTERAHRRLAEAPQLDSGIGVFKKFYGRFSCVMIDIDNFKRVNDTYGHLVGDKVLKALGRLFNSHSLFREDDIIGRYGGEEFVIILPETNAELAKIPAERFRRTVKALEFDTEKGPFSVTISTGISEYRAGDKTCEAILKRADEALLHAKAHGKDTIVCYEDIENGK
ncbi:MAG: GGDEF domain-containing protein [Spirochaetales bacterium]|nr:GGDEF domain-containing protein [Spirochaetales bacterium]